MLVSSQNAGLVSFRVPEQGQGFKVTLKAIYNPDGRFSEHLQFIRLDNAG